MSTLRLSARKSIRIRSGAALDSALAQLSAFPQLAGSPAYQAVVSAIRSASWAQASRLATQLVTDPKFADFRAELKALSELVRREIRESHVRAASTALSSALSALERRLDSLPNTSLPQLAFAKLKRFLDAGDLSAAFVQAFEMAEQMSFASVRPQVVALGQLIGRETRESLRAADPVSLAIAALGLGATAWGIAAKAQSWASDLHNWGFPRYSADWNAGLDAAIAQGVIPATAGQSPIARKLVVRLAGYAD